MSGVALQSALVAPLAHLGHVLVDLPVFMGPVLLLSLWLLISSRRGRGDRERTTERATPERRDPTPIRRG